MVDKRIASLKKLKPFSKQELDVIAGKFDGRPDHYNRVTYKIRVKLKIVLDNIRPALTHQKCVDHEIIEKLLEMTESALRTAGHNDLSEVVAHVHDEYVKRTVVENDVD